MQRMLATVAAAGALVTVGSAPALADRFKHIDRVVVIYEENHSFDNLYGGWDGVDGLAGADAAHTTQVGQTPARVPYTCLKQNDPSLTSPSPLPPTCTDSTTGTTFQSAFTNAPFTIDQYIPPTATTCPNGVPGGAPGGCTRDLVHRFYQEPYQLDGGRQDRYVTGSDAIGLTMGVYDTQALPIYSYLHAKHHPHYTIADRFFQSAFGGSFLNHQWLIAARTPTWPGALNNGLTNDLHSVIDANGMPVNDSTNAPLYLSPLGAAVRDQALTASCSPPATRPPTPAGFVCGDYAVNTIQPLYQPYSPGTAPAQRLPAQTAPTIGDRLSDAGIDWAWYSGGWSNANGDIGGPGWTNGTAGTCADPNTQPGATFPNCPHRRFQYHHQPLNYYASFAPGTAARAQHLRDEAEFIADVNDSSRSCRLKPVSFIKPLGPENEHPGYASEHAGSTHLVDLLEAIEGSRCAKNTMVIVTYDEFGGQWDHVSPPGQGNDAGPHDQWGPGTRIPALIVSPRLQGSFSVDHTEHDTTSILSTIEHRFGLDPLTTRDAAAPDLRSVFENG
jgi:acid phosphatase